MTESAAAALSGDQILAGLGLVIVLAIACRLAAVRFRIPAIVLLLPVGFAAGAITDDVHPEALFGAAFQPLVSLGVGLILFEAGLRLNLGELGGGVRRVVLRLISGGTGLTFVAVTVATKLIFSLDWGVSAVLGAVLVVSGPTVVLPLLSFVRPTDTVRSVLKWEGTLIDPIGALLGVFVLHAVLQGSTGDRPFHPGELLSSLAVGFAVGAAAAVLLRAILLPIGRAAPGQAVAAVLMALAAAIVGADLIREDSGLVAAAVMGTVMAHRDELDTTQILRFQGTIVELLIGILFVLISASVTPEQVGDVLWRGLALVAFMVLVLRPLVVAIGTRRSTLDLRERAFAAWMAPRGIVAAATASAFGLSLTNAEVGGAERILPIAFVVIFATVVLYGLSAAPVARLLGVAGTGAPVVLLVGAHSWARSLAAALGEAGVTVRLWTGSDAHLRAAREAGLEATATPLGVDVEGLEAELEEVSDALVVTESDDFNALAAFELRQELGRDSVYRLAPRERPAGPPPAHAEGAVLFSDALTHPELERRFAEGAELIEIPAPELAGADGAVPLFAIDADHGVRALTAEAEVPVAAGETLICLATIPDRSGPRHAGPPRFP